MNVRLMERLQAREAYRRGPTMLHPECPIEQSITARDARLQAALMQEIWRPYGFLEHGTLLVAEPSCLRVLARTEAALRPPVEALSKRYGDALVVEPPSVRYALGAPVLEPYMSLLVCGPRNHLAFVTDDLSRRGARVTRLDPDSDRFVLEAEGALGRLLGYREWLDERTAGGDVDVSMWLSRYLPIDEGPYAA